MNKMVINLKSIAGLCLIITTTLLMATSCEESPSSPEQKIFLIWTIRSQAGTGTLYQNSPNDFVGGSVNVTGLSGNIRALYLTNGDSHLWSVGGAELYSRKILKIDPKTAVATEMDITSSLYNSEPEGLAWHNGKLWCIYHPVSGGFVVCTLDPITLAETVQTQFSFNYNPNTRRIRGIDIDAANNLLWVGVALCPFVGSLYYWTYDAYDLTTGSQVKSLMPATHYYSLWACDIKVGETHIWSTNKDGFGNVTILKTNKDTGEVQVIYPTDAGADGITF